MQYTFSAASEQDLASVAKDLMAVCKNQTIFAFIGEMGAGKTTFIRALCNELQVTDTVNSPTFAIINEYETASKQFVYHFDFYRVKSVEEAYNFGCETYFDSGNICLIEWPQLVEPLLPDNYVSVHISVQDNNKRIFKIEF